MGEPNPFAPPTGALRCRLSPRPSTPGVWRRRTWPITLMSPGSRASTPSCFEASTRPRTSSDSMTLSRRSDNDLHVKIVVTVKQVPDPNSATLLEPDHTLARDREVVLDPGDECGIEEGLQLKEAHGGEVILVSMGPERAKDAIRKGLSMGADRGVLISDPQLSGADALLTARVLAAAIKPEQPDIVICATESYDGSTGMVPPMLAELLGMPQLTIAKKVEVDGSTVKVHRQTADGYQVVESSTPALITVTAGIAEPRYASLKGIMAARSKEIKLLGLTELGIERGEPGETIEGLADAETRKAGTVIQDDGTAVDRILQVLAQAKVV